MAIDVSGKLNISELDFQSIKTNLKAFMASQSEFSGYDFEGSTFDILFDILAYNTHYNAYYMNMLASESFLDTAMLRNSVVSKAKAIGYTPKSVYAPRASISLAIDTGGANPSSFVLDKYVRFNTTIDDVNYTFSTSNSYIVYPNTDGNYIVDNVELIQGVPTTYRYTANTSDVNQKFLLQNANTDVTTLQVSIKTSNTSSNVFVYERALDITSLKSDSNVYFLSESLDGQFEVSFGDNVFGRAISDGNIVILTSIVTEGAAANKANKFTLLDTVAGYTNTVVVTNASAYGGADRESINEIKFNAPLFYDTQNRLVTAQDYSSWLLSSYSDAASITSWGGETNDPPVYGKVFVAIKPKSGLQLTETAKENIITNFIKPKNIVTITPEIVPPSYTYIMLNVQAKYNNKLINKSVNIIKNNIVSSIVNYSENNLSLFEKVFRFSRITRLIDNTDIAITSNVTTIILKKYLDVIVNNALNYTVKFSNKLYHPFSGYIGTLKSTYFTYYDEEGNEQANSQLDDFDGVLRVVNLNTGNRVVVAANVGTISYITGQVNLISFSPTYIAGNQLEIYVQPESTDIRPIREEILLINASDVIVNMVQDTLS